MLKTRYVFSSFLRIFSVSALSFIGIFIFARIMDDLSDSIKLGEKLNLLRYLYDVPSVFVEISPIITFLSGMFLLSEMLKHGELKTLEISGISFRKIFYLISACGLLVSAASFYIRNFAMPRLSASQDAGVQECPVNFSSPGYLLHAERFLSPSSLRQVRISMPAEADNATISVVKAESASYTGEGRWVFNNGTQWIFNESGILRKTSDFRSLSLDFPVTPDILSSSEERISSLSFPELKRVVNGMKKLGISSPRIRSHFHERTAYPLLNFFLLFILLPFFSVRKKISGILVISSSILLAFAAYGIYAFGSGLAVSGKIPPAAGVWMLHVLAGLFMLFYTRASSMAELKRNAGV